MDRFAKGESRKAVPTSVKRSIVTCGEPHNEEVNVNQLLVKCPLSSALMIAAVAISANHSTR